MKVEEGEGLSTFTTTENYLIQGLSENESANRQGERKNYNSLERGEDSSNCHWGVGDLQSRPSLIKGEIGKGRTGKTCGKARSATPCEERAKAEI